LALTVSFFILFFFIHLLSRLSLVALNVLICHCETTYSVQCSVHGRVTQLMYNSVDWMMSFLSVSCIIDEVVSAASWHTVSFVKQLVSHCWVCHKMLTMVSGNVFYMMEYRETFLLLLKHFDETRQSR